MPSGKDAYYFPHDSNAQHDEKILKLRVKYGWTGYGLYWAIIEKLREASNYRLDSQDIACLSLGVSHPIDDLIAFLKDCYLWELLTESNGYFFSESLCRRMIEIDKRREQLSDAGKRGNLIRWKGNRKAIARQSQGNRSKVKESKVNNDEINDFFSYFLLKTKKDFKMNEERQKLISKRLKGGFTLEQLKLAVDNFVQDDWEGRAKSMDLVYCIGIRNKVDNLEKWLNVRPKPRGADEALKKIKQWEKNV
jgi:uncharacterized phage protein (TIGR02220 family)